MPTPLGKSYQVNSKVIYECTISAVDYFSDYSEISLLLCSDFKQHVVLVTPYKTSCWTHLLFTIIYWHLIVLFWGERFTKLSFGCQI